jgi:hypothetical protein
MNPVAWLERTAPGFDLLSGPEREAIKDFSLLWTLYEGTILHASGSADSIMRAVGSLKSRGKLSLDPFRPAILHFTGRYFDGTELTDAVLNRLSSQLGDSHGRERRERARRTRRLIKEIMTQ